MFVLIAYSRKGWTVATDKQSMTKLCSVEARILCHLFWKSTFYPWLFDHRKRWDHDHSIALHLAEIECNTSFWCIHIMGTHI